MNQFDYQRALFASSKLKANDVLVGCVIGSHYNWKTKEASFPSNKTIAQESHLSVRAVIRAKNNLVSYGYLVSNRRYDMSNTYIPTVPQSHDQCPIGNLKDTLIDTLKDTLKDTNEFSNENSYTNSNTKKIAKEDINIEWESDTSSLASFKAQAAAAPWNGEWR